MAEQAFLATPNVSGRGTVIASPFQWLFGGDDNLRVVLVNSAPGVSVDVQGRFWPRGGRPEPFRHTLTPTSDRTANQFDRPVGDGYLLNLSVVVTAGAPLIGQTYCMIQVIRGLFGATHLLGCLLGGYVTAMQHVAYPGSPIQSSTEGEPYVRSLTGTNPAAGVEIGETVPTGARWELLSLYAFLQAAAAPKPYPELRRLAPGAVIKWQVPLNTNLGAGGIFNLTWGQGLPNLSTGGPGGTAYGPLPERCLLNGGDQLVTSAVTDPADNWSAPELVVREWLEVA